MARKKQTLTTTVSRENAEAIASQVIDNALARDVAEHEKFVAAVEPREPHYKHSPLYKEAVRKACTIVRNYLFKCHELYPDHWVDPPYAENLEEHDLELTEQIANAIFNARVTRGY